MEYCVKKIFSQIKDHAMHSGSPTVIIWNQTKLHTTSTQSGFVN